MSDGLKVWTTGKEFGPRHEPTQLLCEGRHVATFWGTLSETISQGVADILNDAERQKIEGVDVQALLAERDALRAVLSAPRIVKLLREAKEQLTESAMSTLTRGLGRELNEGINQIDAALALSTAVPCEGGEVGRG